MGVIKISDSLSGKLFVGDEKVKSVYVGCERVYPNIVAVDIGTDAGEWLYSDPTRTRTLRLWEQDVYADGSRGEKRYTGTTTETQTAAVTDDWDGATYWDGACGSNYYYVDYKKIRTKYAYADTVRYGAWRNGDSRSRRVDGQCGWTRDWRVSSDWANTGSTCNSAGTVGAYDCDGTYTVKYYQQRRVLSYCYPDMSGSTQTKTEYRVGSVASRSQVNGQCGYVVKRVVSLSVEEYNMHELRVVASEAVASAVQVFIYVQLMDGSADAYATLYPGQTWTPVVFPNNNGWPQSWQITYITPTEDDTCRYVF